MSNHVIDCQVHCYERNHAGRPWRGSLHGPPEVTGADMCAFMDRMGIDGALLVSPWALYRFDASYAVEVWQAFPDRFGLIKPFDPREPDVDSEVRDWAGAPGTVGARLMMGAPASTAVDPGDAERLAATCAEVGLPLNVLCWGNVGAFAQLASRCTQTQFVVDHLGLMQPFDPPAPEAPFADLDDVLALAALDNVAIKVSGACTLSHVGFPFDDIWPPLERMFEAFGLERCMWGTDWTRAVEVVSPEDSVAAFVQTDRLSVADKAALMGGSLARIYQWQPGR